ADPSRLMRSNLQPPSALCRTPATAPQRGLARPSIPSAARGSPGGPLWVGDSSRHLARMPTLANLDLPLERLSGRPLLSEIQIRNRRIIPNGQRKNHARQDAQKNFVSDPLVTKNEPQQRSDMTNWCCWRLAERESSVAARERLVVRRA